MSYTGIDDLWLRHNDHWITLSTGPSFAGYFEIVDSTGERVDQAAGPDWIKSDRSTSEHLFGCFAEMRELDEFGWPTEILDFSRVDERGAPSIRSFDE